MRTTLVLTLIISTAALLGACGEANTNTNSNVRNTNINRTATPSPAPTIDRSNSNITREEYDKNRAEYEKDRGSSTIGQGINDSWIWFKTRAALAAEDDLRDSTINVDVVDDKITLKGTVATAAQKSKAETVAKGIEGQKGVTNQLTVRPKDSMTNQAINGNARSTRTP
ncbi:MAG: BON domain-containing protein [Pyrinomonadaceae bacterium]